MNGRFESIKKARGRWNAYFGPEALDFSSRFLLSKSTPGGSDGIRTRDLRLDRPVC